MGAAYVVFAVFVVTITVFRIPFNPVQRYSLYFPFITNNANYAIAIVECVAENDILKYTVNNVTIAGDQVMYLYRVYLYRVRY